MANAELILPLPFPAGGVSAYTTAAGFQAVHIGNDYAGVKWRSGGGIPTDFIEIDFGVDVAVNRLMLFGVACATVNAGLDIRSSTNAQGKTYAGWGSGDIPLYAGTQRLVNGVGVSYAQITSPPSRYWIIYFKYLDNAQVDIGRLVMGQSLSLARNFKFGAEFGVRSFATSDFSARGAWLRRKGKKLRTVGVSFPSTEKWEMEEQVLPLLEQAGDDTPVALITDPAAHAMRERRCYFGPMFGTPPATWRNARGWEWRADVVSLF